MDPQKRRAQQRTRRKQRVRKRLRGDADQPRLCVSRSHNHIAAQVINDLDGRTLASASTLEKKLGKAIKYGGNKEAAAAIGKAVAQRATELGINSVCFDRGPYRYHGRVAALADAAREAGLQF